MTRSILGKALHQLLVVGQGQMRHGHHHVHPLFPQDGQILRRGLDRIEEAEVRHGPAA
jgi:hypothetical protein